MLNYMYMYKINCQNSKYLKYMYIQLYIYKCKHTQHLQHYSKSTLKFVCTNVQKSWKPVQYYLRGSQAWEPNTIGEEKVIQSTMYIKMESMMLEGGSLGWRMGNPPRMPPPHLYEHCLSYLYIHCLRCLVC